MLPRLVVLALGASPLSLGAQAVRLTHVLRPEGNLRGRTAQLVFTVEAARAPRNSKLNVLTANGLLLAPLQPESASKPASHAVQLPLGDFTGRTSKVFSLDTDAKKLQRGKYRVVATVTGDSDVAANATAPTGTSAQSFTDLVLAQAEFDVEFAPSLSVARYLFLGLLGVLVGYALRLVIKVRDSIPAPNLAPVAGGGSKGPLTAFVETHYYWVDCGVTLAVAFIVLLFFIKDGFPPDAASRWYGAFGSGAGLGLLTNSELITKLPR